MNNELTVKASEFTAIEPTKAQTIASKFAPAMEQVNSLTPVLSTLNKENPSAEDSKVARETRLALVKARSLAGEVKESMKRGLIDEGRLIDSLYNVVTNSAKLAETDLEKIEKHVELQEKARKEQLKLQREIELKQYEVDTTFYNLADIPEEQYKQLVASSKISYDLLVEKRKKEEAEKLAAEKKAEEDKKKLEEENKKLREEAEERTKKEAQEKAKRDAELEAERKAKEAVEAKLKEAQDKSRKEEETKAKQLAEQKEQERQALLAPDKEKVKKYFEALQGIEKPALKDAELAAKLDTFIKSVTNLINNFK